MSTYAIKVVPLGAAGWRVFTSCDGNGWWALGVDFTSEEAAGRVAEKIGEEIEAQGEAVSG